MTHKTTRKFGEGSWFSVLLPSGGYVVGVIARRSKKSRSVLFGYFFGPRRREIPGMAELVDLRAESSIWRCKFGYLGLRDGNWPIIGTRPGWVRDKWPMPNFYRRDPIHGLYSLVAREDDDPNSEPRVWRVTEDEVVGLPHDGLAGAGFVQEYLDKIVDQ